MNAVDAAAIKRALETAGIEVYRAMPNEIQVAERVRLHIMDSGVRVVLIDGRAAIRFTARSQRSDFPHAAAEELFERVRSSIGRPATERGYIEATSGIRQVLDPVDSTKVLDVWHEVTYQKSTDAGDELITEVRWALTVEKYVTD